MELPYRIRARGERAAEILIYRDIGETWNADGITAARFRADLDALGDIAEVTVRINSPGGSVWDGFAIYNALKQHPARVTVYVDGLAASIASVIAMAGDRIVMGDGALLMIHDPWQLAVGNAEQLRRAADLLDKVGEGLVEAYAARAKASRDQIVEWMAAETWFSAAEAVEHGFADATAEPAVDALAAAAQFDTRSFRNPSRIMAMTANTTTPPTSASEVLAAEKSRRAEIRSRFGAFAAEHRELLDACLDDPAITADTAGERLLAALGRDVQPLASALHVAPGSIGCTSFRDAAADALALRAGLRLEKPHAAAADLRTMSVLNIARACVSQAGRSHRGLDGARLIKAALSTSDFPAILENTLGKSLRAGYENDPQSHSRWVKRSQVPDFKTQSRFLLGSAPELLAVPELGEYKYGPLSEDKAVLAIEKFGRLLRISWEALINDDLRVFSTIPQGMGAAARRAEADGVYALFTANAAAGQTMQDGNPLFDASHANISATAGAISIGTLGAARALLRKQMATGNGGYLNLNPRYLIVPAESETLAEQVMTAATRHTHDTVSTTQRKLESVTPEWVSQLALVVEPRLDPANGFYLAAGHEQIDTCELATLEADGGQPVLEDDHEFERDAQSYKVRHTFVAKFIDWKGIVRVPVS